MSNINENVWVYDIETYQNCFSLCAVYANGKGMKVFEISDRKNESEEMLEFLRNVKRNNHKMVGFNNINFDYPVIHFILEKAREAFKKNEKVKITAKQIYNKAMECIKSDSRFGARVKDSDIIIPQIDLYLIHHFDNKARATSLKMLEFNMRSDNIEDLPFELGINLNDQEKDVLIKYNKHDVLETLKFYNYSKENLLKD